MVIWDNTIASGMEDVAHYLYRFDKLKSSAKSRFIPAYTIEVRKGHNAEYHGRYTLYQIYAKDKKVAWHRITQRATNINFITITEY